MAWSTQELARLSGTTVNTIRHYHRLGILAEPERHHNGYKQYGVPELVRLLKIRRLAELGVPLARIDGVSRGDDETHSSMHALRGEIEEGIARLEKARDEVVAILESQAPPDGPAGFEAVAGNLSPADMAIIHIYSQVYDDEALEDVKAMVAADTEGIGVAISALPVDADDETRQVLAERMAPMIARSLRDYPWMRDPASRLSRSARMDQVGPQTFADAITQLYNPAALDVIGRAHELAQGLLGENPTDVQSGD